MTTREVLDKIFRNNNGQTFGLNEFSSIHPESILDIFEKEKGKYYLKCLARNKDLLVWNEEKQIGEPEEIVRQLWIQRLTKEYNYPIGRIGVEYLLILVMKYMKKQQMLLFTKKIRKQLG